MLREGQSIARRPLGGTETWRKGTQVHWMGRRERRQATSRLQPQAEVRAQATVQRRLGNQGERSRRPGDLLCLVVLRPGSQAQRPKVQTEMPGVWEPGSRALTHQHLVGTLGWWSPHLFLWLRWFWVFWAVMLAGAMLPTVWGTTAVTTLAAAMLAVVEGTLAVAMLAAMLTPPDMQLETAPPSWAMEKDSLLTFRNGYPSLSLVLRLAAVSLPFGEGT
ncbi:UNVERIFIED_CONTAM: hypothetical protein FKN15_020180 [Acipenser sinensis]